MEFHPLYANPTRLRRPQRADCKSRRKATAPTSAITQCGYDNNGNLTSTTDPQGRVTNHGYDALNRLVSVIDPYNGAAKPTTYVYDQADNLTKVTDPQGLDTMYSYNGHNNLITLRESRRGDEAAAARRDVFCAELTLINTPENTAALAQRLMEAYRAKRGA